MYSVVCSVHCSVCSVQCAVCSVHCSVCSVQCAVYTAQCVVCSVQYAVLLSEDQCQGFHLGLPATLAHPCHYTALYYTVYFIQVGSLHSNIHSTLLTAHCTLVTILYYTLYTVHCTLHSAHFTPFLLYTVLLHTAHYKKDTIH